MVANFTTYELHRLHTNYIDYIRITYNLRPTNCGPFGKVMALFYCTIRVFFHDLVPLCQLECGGSSYAGYPVVSILCSVVTIGNSVVAIGGSVVVMLG